jgi:hypothetical protein
MVTSVFKSSKFNECFSYCPKACPSSDKAISRRGGTPSICWSASIRSFVWSRLFCLPRGTALMLVLAGFAEWWCTTDRTGTDVPSMRGEGIGDAAIFAARMMCLKAPRARSSNCSSKWIVLYALKPVQFDRLGELIVFISKIDYKYAGFTFLGVCTLLFCCFLQLRTEGHKASSIFKQINS